MRKQLWVGWSVELDGTTGEERNPNGSWACWGADWAADIQIIEFQAPTSTGLVQRVLDEGGEQMSSLEFAKLLEGWRDSGVREARFCLGAADGFTPEEREGAAKVIAFGRATWPHLMARAMLAEQLWRATSIVAGHPYHRD